MRPSTRSFLILVPIGAAIAAIFLVDMSTPLGLGVPFLYLLTALLAIAARVGNRVLLAIATLGTVLAAAKLLVPPPDGVPAFGQGNRLIFSVLMWTAVGLELARRRFEAGIKAARQNFSQDLERQVQERTEALQKEVAERKQAERIIRDYAERLHGLAAQLVQAQESERAQLAAELHDRIGQNLSALNINLSLNLAQLPTEAPPAISARIRDSLALVERTTEIVRGVMEELHPALLDQYGLATALRWYGEGFAARTGIRVVNELPELFPRLRHEVETTLFRIVQEALTNVAKHAGAKQVLISLARKPAGIELKVADDGVGMDPERTCAQPIGSGWGLSIMAERARSVGAEFRIDALPQRGTSVVVNISNGLWESDHDDHGTDR